MNTKTRGPGRPSKQSDRNSAQSLELGGVNLTKKRRLDIDNYIKAHPDKQFCWINDMDGEVEKYLEAGFEPVERKVFGKAWEGITDRHSSKWEMRVVGTNGSGASMNAYLLMIDKDVYQQIKINPEEQRNQEILEAMGLAAREGIADEQARADNRDVKTYAPNLPTGGVGFDQLQDLPNKAVFNKL